MYGKLFASTFTGSLCGSGPTVFAVWAYVIAHAVDSSVELNPKLLCGILGTDAESVAAAIELLGRPDPDSRNTDHDGRRLIRDGQYQYRVVSHAIYRAMKSDDDRRAYNREKQRESRERRSIGQTLSIRNVNDSQDNTDTDTDTDPRAVRTEDRSTYRTSDRNLMSSVLHENTAQQKSAVVVPLKTQGIGALGAGTLPRDHMRHSICGAQYRICIPASTYAKFSRRYGPDDAIAKPAIKGFVDALEAQLGEQSVGDYLWLEKHFDAWLIETGRVVEPVKSKNKFQTPEQIKAGIRAYQAEQSKKKAARR